VCVCVCVLLGMVEAGSAQESEAKYKALLKQTKMDAMGGLGFLGESDQEHLIVWIKAVKRNDVHAVSDMLSRYNMDPFETLLGSEPQFRSEEWKKIEDRHPEDKKSAGLGTQVRSGLDCAGCAMMEAVYTDNPEMIDVLLKKVEVDNKRHDEQMLQVFTHCMDEDRLHALAFLLMKRSIPKTGGDDNVLLYAKRHHLFASLYLLEKEEDSPHFFQENWKNVDDLVGEAEECEWRARQELYPATVHHKASPEYDDLWAQDHAHPADTQEVHLRVWIDAIKRGNVHRVESMVGRYRLDPFEHLSDDRMTPQYCAMMEAVRTQNVDVIRVLCKVCNVDLGGEQMLQMLRVGMDEGKLLSLALIIMMRPATAGSLRSYATEHGLWASDWLLERTQRQPGFLKEHWGKIGQVLDKAEEIAEEKGTALNKRVARVHGPDHPPRDAPVRVPESEDPRFAENHMWQIMLPEGPD